MQMYRAVLHELLKNCIVWRWICWDNDDEETDKIMNQVLGPESDNEELFV